MFQNRGKRARRRVWPIHAYTGPNGSGKSAAMVWDTIPSLAAGRPVLSTVRLLDYENPRECEGCELVEYHRSFCEWCGRPGVPMLAPIARDPDDAVSGHEPVWTCSGFPECDTSWPRRVHQQAHPAYVELNDWQQVLDAERCDLLLDEVTGVASSRESASMPAPIANKLVQLRRADVVVRWSSPSWSRADKIIRECTQAVTYAQGYLPKTSGDPDRLWRNRRLFWWRTYDAAHFEDFTAGKREQLKPHVVDWHWGPSSPAFGAYDTLDSVSTIGTVSETGTCYRCGGRRARPSCRCPDEAHDHGDAPGGPRAAGSGSSPLGASGLV